MASSSRSIAGRRRGTWLRHLVLAVFLLLVSSLSAFAQTCPAFGADTDCGTIVTVTDAGATVKTTGQGPYDGFDDTLVGVVNLSTRPINTLQLKSSHPIFAFDGDGIVAYGALGNSVDKTGYGGPNAYYTNINTSYTAGSVNFINPIPPNGGISYFSLEDALNSAYSCQQVVNGGAFVSPPPGPTGGANIDLSFTPNFSLSLSQAATFCGFTNFDWVQHITHQDDPSMFFARNLNGAFNPAIPGSVRLSSATTPYSDPPQGGGYTYTSAPDNSYPFYYDYTGEVFSHETGGYTLKFHDAPADGCLPGGAAAGTPACLGTAEPSGSAGAYTNHLAGVNADGTATDLGIGVDYTSNYNGTTGGIYIKKTNSVADNNGTGGITILNVQQDTQYQYDGFTVSSVNGTSSGIQFIYVADQWRLQQFTAAGVYISQFPINGNGRFPTGPAGLAVDSKGNLFLTDTSNKAVSEFDSKGNFVGTFGSYGSGDGQFSNGIAGIAIDYNSNVLVVDGDNSRVESFTGAGVFQGKFGTRGNLPGQFVDPRAIAVDSLNNIYVADATRVQKFSSSGQFLSQIKITVGGRFLFGAAGLAVDVKGDVFLTDVAAKNVVEFDSAGNVLQTFGSYGTDKGQFQNGIGVLALESNGSIAVADPGNYRVEFFDAAGSYLSQLGAKGNNDGQFGASVVVAVTPQ